MTKKEYKELLERYKLRSREINKATIETLIEESPEAQEARVKYLLKPENYGQLFSYYFGKDTPIPLAESACAWYHTAIYKELFHKQFITLFNTIFRGGAKSTHANLGYPFALKENGLAKFFLIIGTNETMACQLLQDLQVQFEANNRIIRDFGIQKSYGNWADGQFETQDRCTFMSLGIDQPFRGLRANGVRLEYVSVDDIEDKKRSMNPRLVDEYVQKITGDVQGAFSIHSERTVVNNNYFTENGFIEKLAKKKGVDLRKIDTKTNQIIRKKFATLYLINLTDKYYNQINEENTSDWTPSWIERYTHNDCLRKKEQYENDKETLSGEFYNTPINAGKRIKEGMIKMVEPLPLKDYELIAENWDLAYSSEACHKAKATAGVKNMQIVVTDVFCRQTDISVALEYHYRKAKEVLKENSALMSFYDASVAQEAVYEPQWRQAAIKYKCFQIPQPQRSTVDKFTKIDTVLVNALLSGVLVFSRELEHNPDWTEAKAQMLNFEKGGKYPVDFPDSLTDLIIQLQNLVGFGEAEYEDNNKPIIVQRKRGGY
ncbi:MAG: hypothetical protein FWC10_03615 [Lentimicrobiaceae bacterium]|nr:hypothetical protein [Lentimicrobiaceae bacterium]